MLAVVEGAEPLAGAQACWAQCTSYDAQGELVRRSAINLKPLDDFTNGAIMATPTSSLPEYAAANTSVVATIRGQ